MALVYTERQGERNNRFTKRDRVLKGADYARSRREGKIVNTLHFKVVMCKNGLPQNRLGLVVSKKVGNAVKRNRIKRLVREYFRLYRHHFPAGKDIIVIAKTGVDSLNFNTLKKEFDDIRGRFL